MPEIRVYLDSVAFCLSIGCSWIKERQAMKPVRGKGTHRLKTEMRKEMWASHQITAFQVLGKEKALTGFPPTLVWFYLINWMYCPWMVFSDAGLHHALSSFFTSLHYSTYCLGRLATFGDIVRQLFGLGLRRAGYALSSFFDSLHYSTYCLGRLATLRDIVRHRAPSFRGDSR